MYTQITSYKKSRIYCTTFANFKWFNLKFKIYAIHNFLKLPTIYPITYQIRYYINSSVINNDENPIYSIVYIHIHTLVIANEGG